MAKSKDGFSRLAISLGSGEHGAYLEERGKDMAKVLGFKGFSDFLQYLFEYGIVFRSYEDFATSTGKEVVFSDDDRIVLCVHNEETRLLFRKQKLEHQIENYFVEKFRETVNDSS